MRNSFNEYKSYVNDFAVDSVSLTEQAKSFIEVNDYNDPNQWYKAYGICLLAVKEAKSNEVIEELYIQLNEDSNCVHSSMSLNAEDYATWFTDVRELNNLFINQGFTRAYGFQYELFLNARFSYKDDEIAKGYLQKGYELGDDLCTCHVGYSKYYGNLGYEQNQDEGLQLLQHVVANTKIAAGELFLLNIEFRSCNSPEEGWQVIEKYSDLLHNQKKGLYVLADYYLREEQDAKAAEVLEEGIANKSAYSAYLLGMMCCNGRFESLGYTVERGRDLLDYAFDYGIVYSGFVLAYSYLYPLNGGERDFKTAVALLEKTVAYDSNEALLELATIRLYNEEYKDIEKGLGYLDRAIENGFERAMSEKAYVLLDSDEIESNVVEAKALLEEATKLGSDYAPYRLGIAYQNAEFEDEPNYEKALEYFELSAERNNGMGLEYAGRYNRYGYAGEPNTEKAIAYYQQGIEQHGSNYCKVELAMMLERGEGVDANAEEAQALYIDALNNEYFFAALRLGFMSEDGAAGEPNLEEARKYFQIAADNDIAEGVYHLARFYRYGIGGEKNEEMAFELFEKALDLGFVDANVDIALFYEEGVNGGEPNYAKAFEYMLEGAEAGFSYAQYKVGVYYSYGYLEDRNSEEGKKWFEKAVENGSPLGMLALGDYYLYGYGPDQEYEKSFEYYKMAEERDYISEGIGICYQFGFGVEKDDKKAFQAYKAAAERHYDAAMFRLGLCYYYGNGVDKDLVEAFYYLKTVADNSYMDAVSYVGTMLIKGEGTDKDPEYGVSYLIQAAEAGIDSAQYELANCYLKGEGVPQSDEQAMQWYQQAAENGNEDAQKIVGGPRKRRR